MNRSWMIPTLLLVLVLTGSFACGAATEAASTGKVIAITKVRVFDGTRMTPEVTVLVKGSTIAAIGKRVKVPAGAEVIDGSGATLLPGFIDGHTHTWGDALVRSAVFGVTTQLDMFTDTNFARAMREEQASAGAPGRADLLSAGILATAAGGHGTQYGLPVPTLARPEEAQAWVDARIAEGSDYVKIVSEDGKPYGRESPALDVATIAALIEAAHRRGKLAVVHVSTQERARQAIEAGADGLVHIFADEPPAADFISLVASKKAFVTPTLTVVESTTGVASGQSLVEDPRLSPYITADEATNLRRSFPGRTRNFQNAVDAVRELKKAGVLILAGSDAPNPGTAHGVSMHREMELLVDAGLSPVQALAAATSAPAKAYGLKDRGRIAPKLRADLVLVKGDPSSDITVTRDILRVWKIGQEVSRPEAPPRAAAGPAPAPQAPVSGEISGFEDGTLAATFGAGWQDSTDQMAGGKSIVKREIIEGGAEGSGKSLAISGEIREGFAYPWSGVIFVPGARPMTPANLSQFSGVSFWTKGDGGTYQFMLFATRLGMIPAQKTFTAGTEWQQVTVPFAELNLDGSDIVGIFVGGGPAKGPFRFQVDGVKLVPKP